MPRAALSSDKIGEIREHASRAALSLYAKGGTGAITMRKVGETLGLSAMALYKYFPGGKRVMLVAVRVLGLEELAGVLEDVEKSECEPNARLRIVLRTAAVFARQNPNLYRWAYDTHTSPASVADVALRQARRRIWTVIARCTEACVANGFLKGEPQALAHLFVAAIHGSIAFEASRQQCLDDGLERLVDQLIGALIAGVAGH